MLAKPIQRVARRHRNQMPKQPQLVPFDTKEQLFHLEFLLDVRAFQSLSKATFRTTLILHQKAHHLFKWGLSKNKCRVIWQMSWTWLNFCHSAVQCHLARPIKDVRVQIPGRLLCNVIPISTVYSTTKKYLILSVTTFQSCKIWNVITFCTLFWHPRTLMALLHRPEFWALFYCLTWGTIPHQHNPFRFECPVRTSAWFEQSASSNSV